MGDGNERERDRKGTTESKEEKKGQEKGEELGKELKMKCVSRVVKMHYWKPYRLAPLKFLAPLWSPHSKKLAPPLLLGGLVTNRTTSSHASVPRQQSRA